MISIPSPLTIATFAVLAVTVLSLYWSMRVWGSMLALAVGLGYWSGVLSSFAALWIALLALACLAERRLANRRSSSSMGFTIGRVLALAAIVGLTLALAVHVLPGFANPQIIDDLPLTPSAAPYDLYLNFDKTSAGILLLGLLCPALLKGAMPHGALLRAVPIVVATVAVVVLLSTAIGYLDFEPKWMPLFWTWAAINLLFTCVTEETFFRGFLQTRLEAALQSRRAGKWIALGLSSLTFGIAHLAGGWTYVVLATIAGVGYGYALQVTRRIEAAVLVHFGMNALHFLLFTYPRAA